MCDLPVNSGAASRGIVRVGPADKEEERLLRGGLLLDELHRRGRDVSLHLAAVLQGVGPHLLQVAVGLRLPDPRLGGGDSRLGQAGALHGVAIHGAVGGLDDAHMILVVALPGRPALLARAEVPLADVAGGIALTLEQLTQRHFTRLQGVGRAGDDDGAESGALGIAAGLECRARRAATRFDEELGEPQALARELVDAGRRHAAHRARAIRADVAVADVVTQHDDDVGPGPERWRCRRW